MKTIGPLLAAGSTFAGAVLAGLVLGIWLDHRAGTGYWVLAGFFAGIAIGGFAAWRLVSRVLAA